MENSAVTLIPGNFHPVSVHPGSLLSEKLCQNIISFGQNTVINLSVCQNDYVVKKKKTNYLSIYLSIYIYINIPVTAMKKVLRKGGGDQRGEHDT